MKEASENKEEDKDCYKEFEMAYLAMLYGALTLLYLTASTVLQFAFLLIVTLALLMSFGKKCWRVLFETDKID